ncbi:MAG: hypothetical protein IJL30_04520 [Clostridia bacterium]|nr:hypothetical protein [Clostridia bacterium]
MPFFQSLKTKSEYLHGRQKNEKDNNYRYASGFFTLSFFLRQKRRDLSPEEALPVEELIPEGEREPEEVLIPERRYKQRLRHRLQN